MNGWVGNEEIGYMDVSNVDMMAGAERGYPDVERLLNVVGNCSPPVVLDHVQPGDVALGGGGGGVYRVGLPRRGDRGGDGRGPVGPAGVLADEPGVRVPCY